MTSLTTVTLTTVPLFIRSGWLYQNLTTENSDAHVQVPTQCCQFSEEIATTQDIVRLLHTLRFWMIDELPLSLITFVLESNLTSSLLQELTNTFHDIDSFQTLCEMRKQSIELEEPVAVLSCQLVVALERTVPKEILSYFLRLRIDLSTSDAHLLHAIIAHVARSGDTCLYNWAMKQNVFFERSHVYCLAKSGQLSILKTLNKQVVRQYGDDVCYGAARGGFVNILNWAQSPESGNVLFFFLSDLYIGRIAAANGHVEVLKLLRRNGVEWDFVSVIHNAAHGGHVNTLEWAFAEHTIENDSELFFYSHSIFDGAVTAGHIHILQWMIDYLHKRDKMVSEQMKTNIVITAAEFGQVDVLEWTFSSDHSFITSSAQMTDICKTANTYGHQSVLKWATEKHSELCKKIELYIQQHND